MERDKNIIRQRDLIVRTNTDVTGLLPFHKKGFIFEATQDNNIGYAYYSSEYYISKNSWRFATEKEKDLFYLYNKTTNNIYKFKHSETIRIRPFCVALNKNNIELYKSMCEHHGIPYDKSWNGSGTYYGVDTIYNKDKNTILIHSRCKSYKYGQFFASLLKLEQYFKLINKTEENYEKISVSKTNTRRTIEGRTISSSRTRQTSIGLRPTGNQVKGKSVYKRIESTKICGHSISS